MLISTYRFIFYLTKNQFINLIVKNIIYITLLSKFIKSTDLFNEFSSEFQNILNRNREELYSDKIQAKLIPKGIILEFMKSSTNDKFIKEIILHIKANNKQKIAICYTKYGLLHIMTFINILKTAIKSSFNDWNINQFAEKEINIVNDISYLNEENIDLLLLNNFRNENYKLQVFFYDEFTINNYEIILNKLSNSIFGNYNYKSLVFYICLNLDRNVEEYLVSFSNSNNYFLKNFKKHFNGLTYEIVRSNDEYIQRVRSINRKDKYYRHSRDYPINFLIKREEATPKNDLLYKKSMYVYDYLNDYKIMIKMYDERNEETINEFEYSTVRLNFKFLIAIYFSRENIYYSENYNRCLFFIINDSKGENVNYKKRTIKIYIKNRGFISTFSYFIDKYENFANKNFLPENISETKRTIDIIKKLKCSFNHLFSSSLTFNLWINILDTKFTENEFTIHNNQFDRYFISFNITQFWVISDKINHLKLLLGNISDIDIKTFLFAFDTSKAKNDEHFSDLLFFINKNYFKNMAISKKMIQQQKYSNTFGLRIVSKFLTFNESFFLFLIPSFVYKFQQMNKTEIIDDFYKKLKAKLWLLDEVLIAVYEKSKHIIFNHYLMIEMISNFIYFIYLNDDDKKYLIKLVLKQIF